MQHSINKQEQNTRLYSKTLEWITSAYKMGGWVEKGPKACLGNSPLDKKKLRKIVNV